MSVARVDHHPVVERHFSYLGVRVPDAWTSGAFCFGLAVCGLASSAAGYRSGVIGFLGLTGLLTLLFPHFVLKANARNAILWLYPLWTVLSSAWSIDPDRTFHSIQLLLPTIVAALAIGSMPERRAVGAGGAMALFCYIGWSLLYGHATEFANGASAETAFAGVTTGKNYFGHLAAMCFLMSFALLAFTDVARGALVLAFAAFDALISGFALLQSHATGSLLASIFGACVFVSTLVFRRLGWQFRLFLLVTLAGILILYLSFGTEIEEILYSYVLRTFNKDSTLTGRALLWDFADRLIGQKPYLGYGFNAFWYYTNPDAWTLWRTMGVAPMSGFNFHNTPREILIDGGAIGLALYVFSVGYALVRALMRGLRIGDAASAARLAFIVYFLMRMAVETTGFAAVTIDTLLLFGFLCATVDQRAVQSSAGEISPRPRLALREREMLHDF